MVDAFFETDLCLFKQPFADNATIQGFGEDGQNVHFNAEAKNRAALIAKSKAADPGYFRHCFLMLFRGEALFLRSSFERCGFVACCVPGGQGSVFGVLSGHY